MTGATSASGGWDDRAEAWTAWARTPDHDSYWPYSPGFFEQIVPPAGRRTLELGCGEGRVVRDLRDRGHRVVGLDASARLLAHARDADPDGTYVLADGARLPFPDRSFDTVVAYNSLMDIADMQATVAEAGRVLEPGGVFAVCVVHPINDAGSFEAREPGARFVIEGSYFGRHPIEDTIARDGLSMTFVGWRYPLEAYAEALRRAGLAIERLREPAAPPSEDAADERWRRLPMFLWLRARKGR